MNDTSNPNAILFSYQEECLHNQRVLKAISQMYTISLTQGNTARAAELQTRYFAFLRDFKIGVETE